jgi:histone acetyltransferase (RNA polymerase elongator complex component)
MLEKKAQHGVTAAVRACDAKMCSVAYVSGIITKGLLNNIDCDICKKYLISEVPSTLDIYTVFKEHNSTVQYSLLPIQLRN